MGNVHCDHAKFDEIEEIKTEKKSLGLATKTFAKGRCVDCHQTFTLVKRKSVVPAKPFQYTWRIMKEGDCVHHDTCEIIPDDEGYRDESGNRLNSYRVDEASLSRAFIGLLMGPNGIGVSDYRTYVEAPCKICSKVMTFTPYAEKSWKDGKVIKKITWEDVTKVMEQRKKEEKERKKIQLLREHGYDS